MTARVFALVAASTILGACGVFFLLLAVSAIGKSLAHGDLSGAVLTGKGIVNVLLLIAGSFLLRWSAGVARKARRPAAAPGRPIGGAKERIRDNLSKLG